MRVIGFIVLVVGLVVTKLAKDLYNHTGTDQIYRNGDFDYWDCVVWM